jgi:hypothetical protein
MVSQASVKGLAYQSLLAGAITPAEAAKQIPPKTKAEKKDLAVAEDTIAATNIVLIMASKTPGPEVQVMKAAVTWAMKQSGLQDELLNQGITDRLISGSSAKKTYLGVERNVSVLARIINSSS